MNCSIETCGNIFEGICEHGEKFCSAHGNNHEIETTHKYTPNSLEIQQGIMTNTMKVQLQKMNNEIVQISAEISKLLKNNTERITRLLKSVNTQNFTHKNISQALLINKILLQDIHVNVENLFSVRSSPLDEDIHVDININEESYPIEPEINDLTTLTFRDDSNSGTTETSSSIGRLADPYYVFTNNSSMNQYNLLTQKEENMSNPTIYSRVQFQPVLSTPQSYDPQFTGINMNNSGAENQFILPRSQVSGPLPNTRMDGQYLYYQNSGNLTSASSGRMPMQNPNIDPSFTPVSYGRMPNSGNLTPASSGRMPMQNPNIDPRFTPVSYGRMPNSGNLTLASSGRMPMQNPNIDPRFNQYYMPNNQVYNNPPNNIGQNYLPQNPNRNYRHLAK